jgi:hypothetical protein
MGAEDRTHSFLLLKKKEAKEPRARVRQKPKAKTSKRINERMNE